VWVGQDQVKKVSGLSGSSYPAYIWTQFMKEVHEDLPREDFPSYSIDMENDPYYAPETEMSASDTDVTEDTTITDTSSDVSTDQTMTEDTTSDEGDTGETNTTEAPVDPNPEGTTEAETEAPNIEE
jgi:membrane peptidoglycan carboxypeptidase